ncbi:Uncharacterized conserved protein [Klebsiella pneumoniae subsp. pneumoniae]|uniref:Uncharacterized conserved protein n=1 Tax=Klebsiella pneumoniae subsp. pneumoniae TaxID=72407 RepID=A0A377ZGU4_KLEPN|nr:Uncharacterized conserved protein [Klebsiella pneumoniae subsp. pneumoniae]
MAKNYVQDGKTIPLKNAGAEEILSGTPVALGGSLQLQLPIFSRGV